MMSGLATTVGDGGGVGRGELRPGRADEHGVRVPGRRQRAVGLVQVREGDQGVARRLGIVDHDLRAEAGQPVGHVQGRGVADVVGARLERRAPERDPLA